MHGLVSLVPQPYYDIVNGIWNQLESKFEISGIRVTPYPHFSWIVFEDCQLDRLDELMKDLADHIPVFEVQTTGIGMFTEPSPVIYIPVVKNSELGEIHRVIWDRFSSIGQGISAYYAPDSWVPHISLAYKDINETNIGPVMKWLVEIDTTWKMKIENLSLIFEPDGEIGLLRAQHSLKKEA